MIYNKRGISIDKRFEDINVSPRASRTNTRAGHENLRHSYNYSPRRNTKEKHKKLNSMFDENLMVEWHIAPSNLINTQV